MASIALNLGELSIAIEVDKNPMRAGMAQAKRELESLPPVAQREMVRLTAVMDSEGRKAGGKLAQGINAGLIRNSPIIAAAVGGALAAGAPAAILGATALFGGIGAVAAAQSSQVRAEWRALGEEVSRGAMDDAGVLIPALTGMADDLGASFARLRPQLRAGFEGTAPLIDNVTDGVTALAENAMPGLLRALQSADPVMAGLESGLTGLGTGLGEFLGGLTDHAPAAGQSLDALLQIVAEALPLLGEFLGTGVELASVVLPPLAGAIGEVADVAQALGPALPAIVAGLTALKVAGVVTGGMKSLSGTLAGVAQQAAFATYEVDGFGRGASGRASEGASRMARATATAGESLGRMGAALPAVGVLLAIHASKLTDAEAQESKWSQALMEGGAAAEEAARQAEAASGKYADSWVGNLSRTLDEWAGIQPSMADAQAAADEYVASLTPIEAAQHKAQQAQQAYNTAVEEYGRHNPRTLSALREFESATAGAEREQGKLELALHGVTQAMLDQANQALAGIDADFAYQHAVNQLEDAQTALNEAVKEHGASSEEAQRAQLDLAEQNVATALAYGTQQAALSGLTEGTAEYDRLVQTQMLQRLIELRNSAGPGVAAALDQQIARLQAAGVAVDDSAARTANLTQNLNDMGIAVQRVPGQKGVWIDAPTADQKRRIEDLGYRILTMPNGRVYVVADTRPAEDAVTAFLNRQRTMRIKVNLERGTTASGLGPMTGAFAAAGGALEGGRFHNYDTGGAVWGPGGPTDDLVPALGPDRGARYRLSNGEHIITAAEVRAAGGHGAIMEQRQAWLQGFASGGAVSHKWDPSREGDRSYTAWWDSLLAQGWKGRPGDREERIYAPVQAAAPRAAVHAPPVARAPAAVRSTGSTGAGGGDCQHPLFNIESATIQGPPQEVARQLALEARTHGRR